MYPWGDTSRGDRKEAVSKLPSPKGYVQGLGASGGSSRTAPDPTPWSWPHSRHRYFLLFTSSHKAAGEKPRATPPPHCLQHTPCLIPGL